MARVLGQLVETLSMFMPLKVVLGIVAILGLLAAPFWLESVRDRQIRGTVRRMVRAERQERDALAHRVLSLADGKPGRLRTIVEAATRYDQRDLRERTLALMEKGPGARDAVRFRETTTVKRWRPRNPLEAVVRVEALRAEGMEAAAEEHLQIALETFPDDPELLALRRTV
ncbi:MAG: type II secretion system protein [Myxococcales bacterium]|nr:type II secretion system protein [Myxococcales bacterium]